MKQVNYDKEIIKFLNKTISLNVNIPYNKIIECVDFQDTVKLIKLLDENCQDWDITEELLNYFLKVFIEVYQNIDSHSSDENIISTETENLLIQLIDLIKQVK